MGCFLSYLLIGVTIGLQETPADGDPSFTATVVVPVFLFLVTEGDLKVDVTCVFAMEHKATLAPDVATAIATATPSDTDSATTDEPILVAQVVSLELAPLASIVVGEPMVIWVTIIESRGALWGFGCTGTLCIFW